MTHQDDPGRRQESRRYPHVRVRGDHRDRGHQYGEAASERVHRSLAAYERVFAHYAGWDWQRVCREALCHIPAIEALEPGYLEEMRAIAQGAGVEFEDILALNVRTEVMFAAKARQALSQAGTPGECSSFLLLPQVAASGHTLLGQNWDWLVHCYETLVVLEVEQQGAPDFVTVVEAGLLCKAALNSSGLGLATNALVTADDRGEEGLPYHVVLRAIIDCDSVSDVISLVQSMRRSSSANYLIADRDGVGIDLETAPGDFRGVLPARARARRHPAHQPLPLVPLRPHRSLVAGDARQRRAPRALPRRPGECRASLADR